MYTKNLYWRLLSLLLPRVIIGVAIGTVSSRYGSDLIVLWGGIYILIIIVPVPRLLRRRYLLLGLLVALHIVGLLALHSAGLIGLLIGPLLRLLPPPPDLIDLISSGVIALLIVIIVIIVVLLLVLIVVLLLVLL